MTIVTYSISCLTVFCLKYANWIFLKDDLCTFCYQFRRNGSEYQKTHIKYIIVYFKNTAPNVNSWHTYMNICILYSMPGFCDTYLKKPLNQAYSYTFTSSLTVTGSVFISRFRLCLGQCITLHSLSTDYRVKRG